MLTPIDIQNKTLKAGMGYKKSDVDELIVEIYTDYDYLYRKNAELREKMHILSEGIQYYKKIEKTIQGALVLAEQTAEETQRVAEDKAAAIISQANNQADSIVADAKVERANIEAATRELIQEYERYRLNFKHMMNAQLEFLDSEDRKISPLSDRLNRLLNEPIAKKETQTAVQTTTAAAETVEKKEEDKEKAAVASPVLSNIDALKEEGKELSEKIALIEEEKDLTGDVAEEDEARVAEETQQIEDFIEFAATKDLSSETKTIMEMLKKMDEEKNSASE